MDKEITAEQYESAIRNALKPKQIEVLKMLHSFPRSTATAKQLAEVMNPNNPHEIVASGAIGRIGRAIADYLKFTPELYFNGHKEVLEYYKVVGPYTNKGWKCTRISRGLWRMYVIPKQRNSRIEQCMKIHS